MKAGDRVADYEIVGLLGSGGMGEVYKVRSLVSDRIEAMKVLRPALTADPDLFKRFLREIKVHAALDHPHIVRLHNAQMIGEELIMVMEYVEGATLETFLAHDAIPLQDSIFYADQVLDALAYAHLLGVVHRDIKPPNIMRTTEGSIKLMDFGIARMKSDNRLTHTGQTVGSLFYMSPEQIKGTEPDARSDIYSFGITFYEMVTGTRPFQGDSDFSVMSAHLNQAARAPIGIVPGLPAELNDIILKMIAKEPENRFQTADSVRAALRGISTAEFASPLQAASRLGHPPGDLDPVRTIAPEPGGRLTGRRGLYMALGSVMTFAVLLAIAIEGPRLVRNWSTGATPTSGSGPGQTGPKVSHDQPSVPFGQPASTQQLPVQQVPAQKAPFDPPTSPPPARQSARQVAAQLPTPPTVQSGQGKQALTAPATPAEEAQVQGQVSTPGVVRTTAAAVNPTIVVVPKDLQDRVEEVRARVDSANTTVENLANQLKSQGVGVRPALVTARNTARGKLSQAEAEIAAGHYEEARKSLDVVDTALQEIGKIYGR